MTTILKDYRPIFMVVTFGFLGLAFYIAYRPRRAVVGGDENSGASAALHDARPNAMTFNRIMLWAVTVIAIVFLFFPQAVTNLIASGDEITADMQQTIITIEGMT